MWRRLHSRVRRSRLRSGTSRVSPAGSRPPGPSGRSQPPLPRRRRSLRWPRPTRPLNLQFSKRACLTCRSAHPPPRLLRRSLWWTSLAPLAHLAPLTHLAHLAHLTPPTHSTPPTPPTPPVIGAR